MNDSLNIGRDRTRDNNRSDNRTNLLYYNRNPQSNLQQQQQQQQRYPTTYLTYWPYIIYLFGIVIACSINFNSSLCFYVTIMVYLTFLYFKKYSSFHVKHTQSYKTIFIYTYIIACHSNE